MIVKLTADELGVAIHDYLKKIMINNYHDKSDLDLYVETDDGNDGEEQTINTIIIYNVDIK